MIPLLGHIGPIPVNSFGLMMALGFFVAGLVMQRDFRRKGEPADLAWALVGAGMAGGLVGAKLLFALHHWARFAAAPTAVLLGPSGFVWYGGFAGGLVATLWPIRRYGVRWPDAADTSALGLAIGYAFGKLGCHLAGDGDWGTATTLPWGVVYPHPVVPWPHPPGIRVHPAPLYELTAALGTFAALLAVRGRVTRAGTVFAAYLLLSGTARFLVEFVRVNPRGALDLTEAQWISLGLGAGAAAWLVRGRRGGPRRESVP